MTLKVYVAKDRKGRGWAPDKPHEVGACEWMVKKAWAEFHKLEELYAILLNLQNPNPRADMVVIQERGLGVLELKHYFNEIHVRWDGVWTAGKAHKVIEAAGHLNPREQVRSYASSLRNPIIHDLLPPKMQTNRARWDDLKFQTGVCFTNHLAILKHAQDFVDTKPPKLEDWEEKFSIFDLDFFTTWVRELRFELEESANHEPMHLEHKQIVKIATQKLGMIEWEEIYPAMLTGHPYGGLVLEDEAGKQVFPLVRDQTLVGRSHKCEVVLPERYGRVSKEHCVIEWNHRGVFLIDMPSRNGTYVRDRRAANENPVRLTHRDVISLGGDSKSSHPCILKFEQYAWNKTRITEEGSQVTRQ